MRPPFLSCRISSHPPLDYTPLHLLLMDHDLRTLACRRYLLPSPIFIRSTLSKTAPTVAHTLPFFLLYYHHSHCTRVLIEKKIVKSSKCEW